MHIKSVINSSVAAVLLAAATLSVQAAPVPASSLPELQRIHNKIAGAKFRSSSSRWSQKRILQLLPLILSGEDVNISLEGMKGNTCLHYACELGSRDLIRCLVESGADVNRVEWGGGNTPLHCSARLASLYSVNYLLEHGANPDIANNEGLRPVDMVGNDDHDAICAALRTAGVNATLQRGAQKVARTLQENMMQGTHTPYSFSMQHGDLVVQPLYDWSSCSSPREKNTGMKGQSFHTVLRIGGYDADDREKALQTCITWDARTLLPTLCHVEKAEFLHYGGASHRPDAPRCDCQDNTSLLSSVPEIAPLLINRDDHFGQDVLRIDTHKLGLVQPRGAASLVKKIRNAPRRCYEPYCDRDGSPHSDLFSVSNILNGCRIELYIDWGMDGDAWPETHYWFYDSRGKAYFINHKKNAWFATPPPKLETVGVSPEAAVRLQTNKRPYINVLFPVQKDSNKVAWLIATHEDCQLYLLDSRARTATLVKEWIVKGSVQWDEQTRRLAIPLEENFYEVYELDAGTAKPAHRYNVITGGAGQYALALPDGRYAGTPSCEQFLTYHSGGQSASMKAFAPWLNRPGEVLEALGGDKRTSEVLKATTARWLAKLGIAADEPMPNPADLAEVKVPLPDLWTENSTLNLNATVEAKGMDVAGLEIMVNGNRLQDLEPSIFVKAGCSGAVQLALPLEHGQNWVEIVPRDGRGMEGIGTRFRVLRRGASLKRRFIVSLGVSRYANLDANLKYAAKDAGDVAKAFASAQGAPAAQILVLTDEQVTISSLNQVRDFLADTTEDDEVILFCAGHGVRDDKLNYYYCGYDFDVNAPSKTGISMENLLGVLSAARARHKLVLLDTCHAGNVGEADEEELARSGQLLPGSAALATRGMKLKKAVDAAEIASARQEDEMEKRYIESVFSLPNLYGGMNIITAVSGARLSMEDDTLGNGVFSKCIIEALGNGVRGDLNRDAVFSVTELFAMLKESVPLLSEQVLQSACRRVGGNYEQMKESLPAPMTPCAVAIEKDQNFALAASPLAPVIENSRTAGFGPADDHYIIIHGEGIEAKNGMPAPTLMFQPMINMCGGFYWPVGNKAFCMRGDYTFTLSWDTPISGTATLVYHSPKGNTVFKGMPFQCYDGSLLSPLEKEYLDIPNFEEGAGTTSDNLLARSSSSLDSVARELGDQVSFFSDSMRFKEATSRHYAEVLTYLLPRIAVTKEWNLVGISGNTALHYTAAMGNQKTTKWLVEHGADINARNADGQTPLDCLGVNKSGLDKWLIDHGAIRTHEIRKGNAVLRENGSTNYLGWRRSDSAFDYNVTIQEVEQYVDTANHLRRERH